MDQPNPAQQAELDALLAKIDAQIEENDLHPILKNAVFLMQNDEGAWFPQGMPIEKVDELKGLLDEAVKEKTIIKAVYDLLKLAAAVGAVPSGKMAGAHLLHLCNQTIHEKNLMAVARGDAEFAPGTLDKARGAVGDTSKVNAPKLGEKAPEGSLKIDQLAGSKRRI